MGKQKHEQEEWDASEQGACGLEWQTCPRKRDPKGRIREARDKSS
jgi:hypothetical protein